MEIDEQMTDITTIHIASDHAGFEMKEAIHAYLLSEGYEVVDHGAHEYDEDDDYPDFIAPAAHAVSSDVEKKSRAIVFGGSGQGEAILANHFNNVRAIVFNGQYVAGDREIPEEIVTARQHNDANVLSIGARFLTHGEAIDAVVQFLETEFAGEERHLRRIQKIDEVVNYYGHEDGHY
jgi:ribose 5-phosphate isomerase B